MKIKKSIISVLLLAALFITVNFSTSSIYVKASANTNIQADSDYLEGMEYIGSGYTEDGVFYELFGKPEIPKARFAATKTYSNFAIRFSGIVTPPSSIYYYDYSEQDYWQSVPRGTLYWNGGYMKFYDPDNNGAGAYTIGYYDGTLQGNL